MQLETVDNEGNVGAVYRPPRRLPKKRLQERPLKNTAAQAEAQRQAEEAARQAQQQQQAQQNVHYANCSEVRAAGAAPIYQG